MSVQAYPMPAIPGETARAAKAVFGSGNFYILVGERLGPILAETELEQLSRIGRSLRTAAAILPLVTFFQFLEELTDDQAIDAIRVRIDWKFALHLPVNAPVFSQNSLCEFRSRVLVDPVSQRELQDLADRLLQLSPALSKSFPELEVPALILHLCSINRLHAVRQAMCQALETLAVRSPGWLRQTVLPHWYGRYNHLPIPSDAGVPPGKQQVSMEDMVNDIRHLLAAVARSNLPEINRLPEIRRLQVICNQRYESANGAQDLPVPNSGPVNCDFCIGQISNMEADLNDSVQAHSPHTHFSLNPYGGCHDNS